jgi:hypothetical protein
MNSFPIWEYIVRWNIYVEIILSNDNVIVGNLRSRKKIRRIKAEVGPQLLVLDRIYTLNYW